MYRSQEERNDHLLRLLPDLKSRAAHYAFRYDYLYLDPEDIFQESAKAFLERAEADPAFLDQPDKDVVRRCALDGWNAVRSQVRQESYQTSLQTPTVPGVEQCTLQDVLHVDTPDPEEEAIVVDVAERTQRTIAWLKPNYQVVCYSLMSGSTRTAAMEAIGTTKQAWPHYRRNLQDAFAYVALV